MTDRDKIQAWRQAGLLDPPAVLERLSRAVEDMLKHCDYRPAIDNMRANFASVCSPDQTLKIDSLSRWIAVQLAAENEATGNSVTNIPALTVALPLLFRGMRRMSAHPFSATATPSEEAGITFDGLLRGGSYSVEDVHNVWDTRDDAGDELVHDVVDVLHLTQEDPGLGIAQVGWASFKAVAAELAKDEPELREMVIGSRELRLLIDAMMPLQGWLSYAGTRLPVREVGADCTDALVAAFEVGGERRGWGANYEVFDRVLATAAPALMNPFHHLLEVFTAAFNPDVEPETAVPVAQIALAQQSREGILTYDRLAQLRTFLQAQAGEPVENLKLKWVWDGSSSSRAVSADGDVAATLAKTMDSAISETFLLVTGSSTDVGPDKTFTFGFYSPYGVQDKPGMGDHFPTDDGVSVAAIFELAPVQSAFSGVLGKPAWTVCGEKDSEVLQFGNPEAGASLQIDLSIGQATFTHKVPAAGEEELDLSAVFRPTAWRGSSEVKLKVKRLEVWFMDE
ncbi:hypothetical protein MAPG_07257 [Magnaporthiopsis poae ATCC 64411]|uniref:TLDc domain-containing protein n=1 Tax=Magnaporthiopsis poae (strain ATCC 64411 / 73-15) TaxID=644358 RepID=A0A0C4E468_MAGP6|nr:hypothetical protein MAPG_07257 [Magnaporthiopsis poae ATCC 64411]